MWKFMRKKRGFSMVEVIVVLAIMATLAAGSMLIAGKNTERAKYVRAQADLDAIQQGFMQYFNLVGSYNGIVSTAGGGNLSSSVDNSKKVVGTTGAKDVLQSFFGKKFEDWRDPWGNNEYQVASSYTTAGKGAIVVFVKADAEGVGAGTAQSVGDLAGLQVPTDNLSTSVASPMLRIVYNVPY